MRVDQRGSSKIAVLEAGELIITNVGQALDLMAEVRCVYDCEGMIVPKTSFPDAFFDLSTLLAGDILQKYTNYQMRLAIVGDFSSYTSKSLKDFIYESNKGNQVLFLPDVETALDRLHGLT